MSDERRKLIEVALPLETINREAAREKSIRYGHPSTLHLWWARRPLAAARAVLFAQLVDDPNSTPEAASIADIHERAEWVALERKRLFDLIDKLVRWESSTDESVLAAARAEILRSTGGNTPTIVDPFAGGGTIPLEAQRLGLRTRASDLNPVAVLINKALLELPSTFTGQSPVFPGVPDSAAGSWPRATGLAEDVRRYGEWMSARAKKRVGQQYPDAVLPDGTTATVVAWIWARTTVCPNPSCGIRMPLARSWWLGKKKSKEAFVVPSVVDGKVYFTVGTGPISAQSQARDGSVTRHGATCISCGAAVDFDYIRSEGRASRIGYQLMATVAQGHRRRIYLPQSADQVDASMVDRPTDIPASRMPDSALGFRVQAYGMTKFTDTFTDRQLVTLTALTDLVAEARNAVFDDALAAGLAEGSPLAAGGTGARAYADAVATYLGLATSRLASTNSSLCRWNSAPSKESVSDTFARQALSMIWDFAEGNPWCKGPSNIVWSCSWIARVLEFLRPGAASVVTQGNAGDGDLSDGLLSTDPPYYDNIGYSDLSDFFYIWLRRSLRPIYPDLLGTLLVPKADELVANPFRHGGSAGAQQFFESGFRKIFSQARSGVREDYPITVYYAFKQSETTETGEFSTGWETLLGALVGGGWRVTGTWPIRSERSGRVRDVQSNALASSIVLALRPRPADSPVADRRTFTAELRKVLPEKLQELQHGSIAAVDLPQAAIGPGMAVFSRYERVVEADGSVMTIRSALEVINQILGEVLWRQEGNFDPATRWCVRWFEAFGFEGGPYGDAETNASAFNTSVAVLDRSGVLTSRGGNVRLTAPGLLPVAHDPSATDNLTLWGVVLHLAKELNESGLDSAGRLLSSAETWIDVDAAKELAYLLFAVAERRGWSDTAGLFNVLAASWSDVMDAARRQRVDTGEQLTLDSSF
jgi:putative DNA methylase